MRQITFDSIDQVNWLAATITNAPEGGYSIGDVEIALSIKAKLGEAAGASPEALRILVEDREHEWLKAVLGRHRWLTASAAIMRGVIVVRDAKAVQAPQEAEAPLAP